MIMGVGEERERRRRRGGRGEAGRKEMAGPVGRDQQSREGAEVV